MTVSALDTDMVTLMRADLVGVLDELGIVYHDYEPKSLGELPAAWLGRPVISYDSFEKEVVVDWPLTWAGQPGDPESTTHRFDADLVPLIRELGWGRRVMAQDHQRSITFLEARPSLANLGNAADGYPVYDIAIRTTVHTAFCT